MNRRLLICEEALLDYNAHFYSWTKAIRQINLDAGAEVLVAGNLEMRDEIRQEFDAIPAYSRNNWSGAYNQPQAWRRHLSVFAHNALVWRETRRLLRVVGPVDAVLLPAVRIHHLMGWRALCAAGLGKSFQRAVFFILTSQADYNPDYSAYSFSRRSALLKWVLKSYAPLVRNGSVVFAGDSHITCAEYERLSGVPFRTFPSPGAGLSALPQLQTHAEVNKVPAFVMLGVSTYDKGVDLLQEAVLRLFDESPELNVRFVIQWAAPTIDPSGRRIGIDERLRAIPQVNVLDRVLSDAEYRSWFSKADFLILPYRRSTYINRISGVAVEAACAGKPMIVPKGTWLSWSMAEFGAGIEVENDDPIDLCRAVRDAAQNWEHYKSLAQSRKEVAMQANSSKKYLECLWD